ncbi:MAG: cupin domain-containing protein [Fimbriimonadales bacterium]
MGERMASWPDELDAMAAAPDYHRLAMENEAVRVLETRIEPGETVRLHTHRWPAAYYILSWSDFVRRDDRGEITLDTREQSLILEPGQSIWSPALGPHTLENVGDRPIHLISVEVKSLPG